MNRELLKELWPLLSIIGLLFLTIFFVIIDAATALRYEYDGVVVDKHFESEKSQTGAGTGITSNGDVAVFSTSSHQSEQFILMVRLSNGEVGTFKATPSLYYAKSIDSPTTVVIYVGRFTGWNITRRAIR